MKDIATMLRGAASLGRKLCGLAQDDKRAQAALLYAYLQDSLEEVEARLAMLSAENAELKSELKQAAAAKVAK